MPLSLDAFCDNLDAGETADIDDRAHQLMLRLRLHDRLDQLPVDLQSARVSLRSVTIEA